ncbi:MAG TPA: hypothetical protein DCS29_02625 [Candidatus Magasanikbacteria bacterium]|nr:MAG: hypothetical protein A2479_00125 [Candidatus Magasanikbacteria bacterium RIFOXYC2_FULL_39_8]HAT03652.1 hypothetical protein [Candidatus Magasanikbacteria bacterium]
MDLFTNLDLFSVGITTAAIGILAFAVFFNDHKSTTNQAFLFFALITVMWGWVNYASYQVYSPFMTLWLNRLAIFFATWHAFGIFQFFYVYPQEAYQFNKLYKFVLVPLASVTSCIVLTPLALGEVTKYMADGRAEEISNGPGMALFGATVFGFIIAAIVILFRKIWKADAHQKIQLRLILIGTIFTFALLLTFNFVLPAVFGLPRFIPLGMVWILPFIFLSSYAIIRHGLLNTRVIGTELLTFALLIVSFIEVAITKDIVSLFFRIGVFVLIFFFSILLIRGVRNEVKQREQLGQLAHSLEKANLRLKELDQQKTEFLSIASHQLRTPLSIIKGYIELIEDGAYGKATKKMKDVLHDMDESNERLVKLVDEFLDITRIEQGRTKFVFENYKINDLISDVVKELHQRAEGKGLKIMWEPNADIADVCMDEEKVRHVVFNFIDNAIKYSDKGIIKVLVEREDGGITVRVKDRGFGFNPIDQANFFQKFYRGENVKGTNVNGTGLGIYVCRKFIESHEGHVWAHSEGLGKGSEFGFWIPGKKPATS